MLRALHVRVGVAACAVALPMLWAQPSFTAGAAAGSTVNASSVGVSAREALANTPPSPALDPKEFRSFKLVHKEQLTHDTARYTFALPRASDELGLPVASCLVVQAEIDGAARQTRGMGLGWGNSHGVLHGLQLGGVILDIQFTRGPACSDAFGATVFQLIRSITSRLDPVCACLSACARV